MQLPALIADGRWHSGSDLAETMGVSRTAVNKQIRKIRGMGLEVQSVRGRGYRLRTPFEPLNEDRIGAALSLSAKQSLASVQVFSALASTNDFLLQRPPANEACFAEYQSGGRGRRGRQWVSPYGANLYFSLGWVFSQTPPALGALSLAVGVELAEMLQRHGADAQLKWPNDIFLAGRKTGGILIDHRGEVAGGSRAVIGVGLNLSMQPGQASAVDQPWTALAQHVELPSRNLLAAQCVDALCRTLENFQANGFHGYRRRWQALDTAFGQRVTLHAGNEKIVGLACGVSADGALLVDRGNGPRSYYAGEISLRIGS